MASTVFTPSLEGMKNVKSEQGEMLSKPFLDVCKLILPVIGIFLFLKIHPPLDKIRETYVSSMGFNLLHAAFPNGLYMLLNFHT